MMEKEAQQDWVIPERLLSLKAEEGLRPRLLPLHPEPLPEQ